MREEILLFDLAIACYIYSNISKFDESYKTFLKSTNFNPDLTKEKHRIELLIWLNAWGCRQFTKEFYDLASSEIFSWYDKYSSQIFNLNKNILNLTKKNLDDLIPAFNSLANKIASYRTSKNNKIVYKIGPTGAAKILFAIRRNIFIPWDKKIREYFRLGKSGVSYVKFLSQVITILKKLEIQCKHFGFSLNHLPEKIGRPNSTVPKLIDEFYWVIITNASSIPEPEIFRKWIQWSGIKF
ncbi:MAG: hypothetical protein ACTSRG_20155 [Candidatus Helarchaeota archaeon]